MTTNRDQVEEFLQNRYPDTIRPFCISDKELVEPFKDGSFGVSSLAYVMYANGRNPRGLSTWPPTCLFYHDKDSIFALGYFRKPSDPENSPGYLFIVGPRGQNVADKVNEITEAVLGSDLPCLGAYARFLTLDQYSRLLTRGFVPAEDHPWHENCPQEDESYCASLVDLDEILDDDLSVTGSTRYSLRSNHNRFSNLLRRMDFGYSFRPDPFKGMLSYGVNPIWLGIVEKHFRWLRELGKDFASCKEDYENLKFFTTEEGIFSAVGYLEHHPVSVFIGERLSESRIGLYAAMTLRDFDSIASSLHYDRSQLKGLSALPTYAFVKVFQKLKCLGFKEVHLGGSETPEQDKAKRKMGAKDSPSYWAFKPAVSSRHTTP